MKAFVLLSFVAAASGAAPALAADPQFDRGYQAVHAMAGCYLIDYSYTETEGLLAGYVRDTRVYDVNKDKSIKEWITVEDLSPRHVRVQHILFGTGLDGALMAGSELRHQAEDWEYDAAFLYDFVKPLNWEVKKPADGTWTRRITNLDDGLRYQCAAAWDLKSANPEWSCDNYAPIPGRETRDMGRKDYNTLQRSTRIVSYGSSWLERQANVKTIDKDGARTPLAKELGKNWYVRLPDSECAAGQAFAKGRKAFWEVLRETWDGVLVGDRAFVEKPVAAGQPNRYARIMGLEEGAMAQDLGDPAQRAALKASILKFIEEYRAN